MANGVSQFNDPGRIGPQLPAWMMDNHVALTLYAFANTFSNLDNARTSLIHAILFLESIYFLYT